MKTLYIDAGGTKSVAYLVYENKIIKEIKNGPGNINTIYEESLKNIIDLINNFEYKDEIIIGIAGTENNINKKKFINELNKIFNIKIFVYSDLELLARICIKENNGLLINAGTGTAVVFKNNDIYESYLGWGKMIGDLGSGYDIGINFIKHLTYLEDHKIIKNYYIKFLKDYNAKNIKELISFLYESYKNISSIASWISKQNEEVIDLFIISRIKNLLDYMSFIETDNIYLTGSIFEKNEYVKKYSLNYYKNKNINFVNLKESIIKK